MGLKSEESAPSIGEDLNFYPPEFKRQFINYVKCLCLSLPDNRLQFRH